MSIVAICGYGHAQGYYYSVCPCEIGRLQGCSSSQILVKFYICHFYAQGCIQLQLKRDCGIFGGFRLHATRSPAFLRLEPMHRTNKWSEKLADNEVRVGVLELGFG